MKICIHPSNPTHDQTSKITNAHSFEHNLEQRSIPEHTAIQKVMIYQWKFFANACRINEYEAKISFQLSLFTYKTLLFKKAPTECEKKLKDSWKLTISFS